MPVTFKTQNLVLVAQSALVAVSLPHQRGWTHQYSCGARQRLCFVQCAALVHSPAGRLRCEGLGVTAWANIALLLLVFSP